MKLPEKKTNRITTQQWRRPSVPNFYANKFLKTNNKQSLKSPTTTYGNIWFYLAKLQFCKLQYTILCVISLNTQLSLYGSATQCRPVTLSIRSFCDASPKQKPVQTSYLVDMLPRHTHNSHPHYVRSQGHISTPNFWNGNASLLLTESLHQIQWQSVLQRGCGIFLMQLSPALHFNGHFPGIPKLAGTFWILIELKIMAMGVTTGATRCARSGQIITNKTTPNFLQAGYPTCCPTISVRLLKEIFSECSYRTKFMLGFPKVCKNAQLLLCSGISNAMHYNIHILPQISMFLINFLNIRCRYKI